MVKSGYDRWSPRGTVEERLICGAFLDARTFLRVIMSFCLSPSTSANWRLSWEYRSCMSFSSVSTVAYLPLSSSMSLISSLISLKLWNTASSSLCCFKKELETRRNVMLNAKLFFIRTWNELKDGKRRNVQSFYQTRKEKNNIIWYKTLPYFNIWNQMQAL